MYVVVGCSVSWPLNRKWQQLRSVLSERPAYELS